MLLAVFRRAKGAMSRLVALLPQASNAGDGAGDGDGSNSQCSEHARSPQGFNVILLPFGAEYRFPPSGGDVEATDARRSGLSRVSEEAVGAAEALVDAMELDPAFDYTTVERPTLRHFYAG